MARIVSIAALLALPVASYAGIVVHVHADQPSNVYVDGVLSGAAPAELTNLPPGTHQIRVVNATNGLEKEYAIYAPRTGHLERDVNVQWGGPVAGPGNVPQYVPPPDAPQYGAPANAPQYGAPNYVPPQYGPATATGQPVPPVAAQPGQVPPPPYGPGSAYPAGVVQPQPIYVPAPPVYYAPPPATVIVPPGALYGGWGWGRYRRRW